jgi:hypothetical protein
MKNKNILRNILTHFEITRYKEKFSQEKLRNIYFIRLSVTFFRQIGDDDFYFPPTGFIEIIPKCPLKYFSFFCSDLGDCFRLVPRRRNDGQRCVVSALSSL